MNIEGLRWRVFFVALVVTLLCVSIFWSLVPPTYLTNDDAAIRRDLAGLTAPDASPTGYVLMAHSLLGWTMVAVQHAAPIYAWDLLLAALLIWSIAAAMALTWNCSGRTLLPRIAGIVAVLVPVITLFTGMQFTISATLAGAVAAAVVSVELMTERPRPSIFGVFGCLLLLAMLVRPAGATAGALLMTALLCPTALEGNDATRRLSRLAALAIVVGSMSVALVYLDDATYRMSPAWDAYRQYNWMTGRLLEWGGDVPRAAVDRMRLQVGWSENDWEMLRRWWGVDPELYSFSHIESIYRTWSELIDWRVRATALADRAAGELTFSTVARLVTASAVPLAAGLLFAAASVGRRGAAAIIIVLGMFLGSCLAIEIGFKELPLRLFAPLQAGLVLAIVITSGLRPRQGSRPIMVLAALVVVALLTREARSVLASAQADAEQSLATDQQVTELLQLRPSLLILHADAFPSEYWWRPFHTPSVRLPAIQVGLNNRNPYVQRFLDSSYQPTLLRTMCTDPSILVVGDEGRLEPVTQFMREHYDVGVVWTQVYSGSFRVWRCSAQTPSEAGASGLLHSAYHAE